MTSLWRHPYPLQLAPECLLPLALRLFLLLERVLLLFQPGGVIPFPGNPLSPVDSQNPPCDIIKKITVMGDCNDSSRIGLQMMLKPCHTLGIEMIRRLIKKQDIRFLKEQPAKGHAALFPACEDIHR